MTQDSPRTRIKICGITRPDDGRVAADLGADAIGLVFYPPSPRAVSVEQARVIAATLPPFICKVALFVDAAPDQVRQVLESVPIDLLQFHGDETAADCSRYGVPYVKATGVKSGFDPDAFASRYPDACGILVDRYSPERHGGSGQTFDWSLIPVQQSAAGRKPLLLAGGLNPDNVRAAIRTLRPYAVDVSSGVEAATGIKDPVRIAAFIREVQHA